MDHARIQERDFDPAELDRLDIDIRFDDLAARQLGGCDRRATPGDDHPRAVTSRNNFAVPVLSGQSIQLPAKKSIERGQRHAHDIGQATAMWIGGRRDAQARVRGEQKSRERPRILRARNLAELLRTFERREELLLDALRFGRELLLDRGLARRELERGADAETATLV